MSDPLKVHVGCGQHRIAGWLNCDRERTPATDLTFDVQVPPWPITDNAAAIVYASHMLEHLTDPLPFFREAWRVLQPNGALELRLPYGGHKAAWWDLTHIRPWFAENFCMLQPGYGAAIGNPQHAVWPAPFGVHAVDLRVARAWARRLRWRWARRRWVGRLEAIPNAIEEMHVHLFALKRPADVETYRRLRNPAVVPVRITAYQHHVTGRDLRPGQDGAFVELGEGLGLAGHN